MYTQDGSELTILNSALIANTVQAGDASVGAVNLGMSGEADEVTAINSVNLSARSTPTPTCGGWCGAASAGWDFSYTNTRDNAGSGYSIPDPTGEDGNLAVDPGFADTTSADAAVWNLNLLSTSPLIDAGDPSNLDPDCTRSDIGVYGGPAGSW